MMSKLVLELLQGQTTELEKKSMKLLKECRWVERKCFGWKKDLIGIGIGVKREVREDWRKQQKEDLMKEEQRLWNDERPLSNQKEDQKGDEQKRLSGSHP